MHNYLYSFLDDFFNREGDILANSEEFIKAYITPPNKVGTSVGYLDT